MKKQEKIAEKYISGYSLPTGCEIDGVLVQVHKLKVNQGVYSGYTMRYGIQITFEDEMLPGDKYEYEETVPVNRVESEGIWRIYLSKVKRERVFESIQELIFHYLSEAEEEAEGKLTEPEHKDVSTDSVEDEAQAALESIDEMENLSTN